MAVACLYAPYVGLVGTRNRLTLKHVLITDSGLAGGHVLMAMFHLGYMDVRMMITHHELSPGIPSTCVAAVRAYCELSYAPPYDI